MHRVDVCIDVSRYRSLQSKLSKLRTEGRRRGKPSQKIPGSPKTASASCRQVTQKTENLQDRGFNANWQTHAFCAVAPRPARPRPLCTHVANMMRFALLAALASAAHAGFNLEKPTGEVFFHAKNGLGADKVGAGAKAKAKLGDGAEVGGELEFNADEVKPEKVWLQYSKKVDDMETDASVVYNFNDEGTAVNLDVETPSAFFQDAKTRLGMTLAQRVPGFIRELRLKQQLR
eukprot:scaffold73_cov252-Pinguiococcus_pyrenoidosus.AAC.5